MTFSEQVLRVLRFERISEEELAKMLEKAAITRIRGFNRRYFHWLFKIQGDTLVEMQRVDIVEVGKGKTRMLEDHESCAGKGCRGCGWVGQIGRWITDKKTFQNPATKSAVSSRWIPLRVCWKTLKNAHLRICHNGRFAIDCNRLGLPAQRARRRN
jgi:hypothetical protein